MTTQLLSNVWALPSAPLARELRDDFPAFLLLSCSRSVLSKWSTALNRFEVYVDAVDVGMLWDLSVSWQSTCVITSSVSLYEASDVRCLFRARGSLFEERVLQLFPRCVDNVWSGCAMRAIDSDRVRHIGFCFVLMWFAVFCRNLLNNFVENLACVNWPIRECCWGMAPTAHWSRTDESRLGNKIGDISRTPSQS